MTTQTKLIIVIIGTKKPIAACTLSSRKMPVIALSMNGLIYRHALIATTKFMSA